jgi:hypothetical protein
VQLRWPDRLSRGSVWQGITLRSFGQWFTSNQTWTERAALAPSSCPRNLGSRGVGGPPAITTTKGTIEPLDNGERSHATLTFEPRGRGVGKLLVLLIGGPPAAMPDAQSPAPLFARHPRTAALPATPDAPTVAYEALLAERAAAAAEPEQAA